jgi:hypothetical protein
MNNIDRAAAVWSYSIYGDDIETYYKPVISNIHLARQEGAVVAISARANEERQIRHFFKEYENEIKIVIYENSDLCEHPKVLRFLISEALDADFYFFKDSDSVVTRKELRIMKEWMAVSTSAAMIIRDHPLHVAPVMAGMFGISSEIAGFITGSVNKAFLTNQPRFRNSYSYDQDWLMSDVYPWLVKRANVYSSFLYYSGENVTRIEREPTGAGFIGAQTHNQYPPQLEKAPFYSWYGDDLLCAPSFLKNFFFYGRVRPTLAFSYLYMKLKSIFHFHTKTNRT